MRRNGMTITAALVAICVLSCLSAAGASARKGMIISRTGDTIVINCLDGRFNVVLTDSTETRDNTGLFGLGKEHLGDTVLIPGLKVEVEGLRDDQGQIVASKITVDGDDLETAEMIQSGLHPTKEQVTANMKAIEANQQTIAGHEQDISAMQRELGMVQSQSQENFEKNSREIEQQSTRFTALADYDVKVEATVKFESGSATISDGDQAQLKRLAENAVGLTGYMVEVTGYTDSQGSAEMNTKLSEDRAKAVIVFLMQQGNVPVRHIVAPGVMGEYGAEASNETAEGRAENRRVEIKVLVNKGITEGMNSASTN